MACVVLASQVLQFTYQITTDYVMQKYFYTVQRQLKYMYSVFNKMSQLLISRACVVGNGTEKGNC